jgi:hypothetical protein
VEQEAHQEGVGEFLLALAVTREVQLGHGGGQGADQSRAGPGPFLCRGQGAIDEGTAREVFEIAEPIAMQGFDRARPQWECTAVDGLADGRGALAPDEPEPPEPGPDYGPIITLLESNLARLEDAGLAVGAAIVDTHELIDRLKAG